MYKSAAATPLTLAGDSIVCTPWWYQLRRCTLYSQEGNVSVGLPEPDNRLCSASWPLPAQWLLSCLCNNWMKPEEQAGKGGKPKSKDLLGSLFAKKESGSSSSLAMKKNVADGFKNINQMLMSLAGTPRGTMNVNPNPITDVYKISSNVLGLGINGKVVECFDSAGEKYALKVSCIPYFSCCSSKYQLPL